MSNIHPAVYATGGLIAVAAAITALLLSGPTAESVDSGTSPSSPPTSGGPVEGPDGFAPLDPEPGSGGQQPTPGPVDDDTLDADGHDDRNEGGDVDVSAHEAFAAAAATEWLTFRSDETQSSRTSRLSSVNFADPQSAPTPRAAQELDGKVAASMSIEVVSIDLVAFSGQTGNSWTFAVLATTTTTFTQPGSSRTEADRIEVAVTVDAAGPSTVLSLTEK